MIFLRDISIDARRGAYPFNSASLVPLHMALTSPVTIIVGDNGSGKSTLLEALARRERLPVLAPARAWVRARVGLRGGAVLL